jgi:putative oxidoreductase
MNQRVVPPAMPATDGVGAMQRLADRLTTLVPPAPAVALATPELPRPSPAVAAALEKSAARIADAKRKAARSSRPVLARLADAFATLCRHAVPYALAGLAVRLVMARVFFLDGQTRALGPQMSVELYGFDLSVIVPLQVKTQVLGSYTALSSLLSVSPLIVANTIAAVQFVLPILLVLGLATRFSALLLLGLTVLLNLHVMPHMLWSAHVYWAALLLVLVSQGAGAISLDQIFRARSR